MDEKNIPETEKKELYNFYHSLNFFYVKKQQINDIIHKMKREDLSLPEFRELWEIVFKHLLNAHFSFFVEKEDKIALGIILRAGLAGLIAAKDLLFIKNIPVFLIWTARKEEKL